MIVHTEHGCSWLEIATRLGCSVTFKMRSDRRADPTRHRGRRVSRGLDCDDAVGQSTLVLGRASRTSLIICSSSPAIGDASALNQWRIRGSGLLRSTCL